MPKSRFLRLTWINMIIAGILVVMDLPAMLGFWNGLYPISEAAQRLASISEAISLWRAPFIVSALVLGMLGLWQRKRLRLVCGLQGVTFAAALLVSLLVYLKVPEDELVLSRQTFIAQTAILAIYPLFLIVFSLLRKETKD